MYKLLGPRSLYLSAEGVAENRKRCSTTPLVRPSSHPRKEATMSFEGAPGKIEATCPQCNGKGQIKENGKDVTCKLCRGKGKVPK